MLDLVQRYAAFVSSGANTYQASVYGERQNEGTWFGFIVFTQPLGGRLLVTGRETTQSTFDALAYWAAGLTPVYLEGALQRALALQPEVQLERRLSEIARIEAEARAQASDLERAAAVARAEASLAERQREQARRELAAARAVAAETEAVFHEEAAARAHEEAKAAAEAATSPSRSRTRSGRSR